MTSAPALLLLDREGVLLAHVEPYILTDADVAVVPGAFDAVAAFARSGSAVAVVTNQSPIGRSLVERSFVESVNARLAAELRRVGAPAAFYVCPHTPSDGCRCRKPRDGMLRQAARDAGVPLDRSWMVGDQDVDMLAATAAGCAERIHVLTGRQQAASPRASMVVSSLPELVARIGIRLVVAKPDAGL